MCEKEKHCRASKYIPGEKGGSRQTGGGGWVKKWGQHFLTAYKLRERGKNVKTWIL